MVLHRASSCQAEKVGPWSASLLRRANQSKVEDPITVMRVESGEKGKASNSDQSIEVTTRPRPLFC